MEKIKRRDANGGTGDASRGNSRAEARRRKHANDLAEMAREAATERGLALYEVEVESGDSQVVRHGGFQAQLLCLLGAGLPAPAPASARLQFCSGPARALAPVPASGLLRASFTPAPGRSS